MVKKKLSLSPLSLLILTFLVSPAPSKTQIVSPSSIFTGGEWRILHSSIGISAMHMQLLSNNKVVMFDRTDFGPSNLSLPNGQCRMDSHDSALKVDCTAHSILYDVATNIFRPLTVETDTWCSSGAMLANGSLLQTGGYNDGDHTIRLLDPCETDQCDWIEYQDYLLERRWYATNQMLPDGRIIVVGGRRQFNYEFYPRNAESSSSTYWLELLRETKDVHENNLYPFLHLLPDGNLFIFANTKSISFDYTNNRVVREFPPIPGGEPRNYPSSGSSVLLPLQFGPGLDDHGTVQAEILVCGGAPQESFSNAKNSTFLPAVSTCGRLKVTGSDPKWEMEEMPLSRVMGDMLILPTGDVMIINGAASGTAGWDMAREPVTAPVLYQKDEPINRRFTVMHATTTPRMYHSTALLIPDGRILVGGSNPNPYYNFTNVLYQTELSLESFSPPYLAPEYNAMRPRILSATEVFTYKQFLYIRFAVADYRTASKVSIAILAPPFTTHGFAMNQRMVMLRVTSVTQFPWFVHEVSAVGPPSAEIAPKGYYLLFVIHAGVPSSGVWVKVQTQF
ncbi:hypothetical protein Sjap_007966 [Stephania japonica]|uniref:Galactose oxidase n=1 Tax=Stephania japonica TaxID=461633 RepID=A0AAP0JQY7_9MAGN